MQIKRIKVANFRSFDALDVELSRFTVIVGGNASGKSNFVEILRFLRDIARIGLQNAISMQGDVEYLRNINIGSSKDLEVSLVLADDGTFPIFSMSSAREFQYTGRILEIEIEYEFSLEFPKRGRGYSIGRDRLVAKVVFERSTADDEASDGLEEELWPSKLAVHREDGQLRIQLDSPDGVAPGLKAHFEQLASFQVPLDEDSLLLESYGFFHAGFPPALKSAISGIGAYDLNPHLAKRAVQITGMNELEDSGSNLAIVLSRLLEDETQRKRFDRLVADFLPFVSDIGVDRSADRSLLFHMSETYAPGIELPASLPSVWHDQYYSDSHSPPFRIPFARAYRRA